MLWCVMAIQQKPIPANSMTYCFWYEKTMGGEKMKEAYKKPIAEVETFATVDVITTSGGGDEPIVTPPDWD